MTKPKPRWAFELWAEGVGDSICSDDYDFPVSPWRRTFWRIRGAILQWMFGWWRWDEATENQKGERC